MLYFGKVEEGFDFLRPSVVYMVDNGRDERKDLPIDCSLDKTEKRELAENRIVRPRSIDKERSFSFTEDTFVL